MAVKNTIASSAAAWSHVTCGNHGTKTKSRVSSASTSKTRSTTTVEVISARDVRVLRWRATMRATSPARAGRIVLKNWPRSVASKVGQYGGRVSAGNRYCQRSPRTPWATSRSSTIGITHQ